MDKCTLKVELIEKELIDVEVIDKDLIDVDLKTLDIIYSNITRLVMNETPSEVDSLPSKKFITSKNFLTGSLQVFLNGQKVHSSEITVHSNNQFSFPINVLSSDKVECVYIQQI